MRKIITAICVLYLSQPIFAASAPKGCPVVADIKKAGIGSVMPLAPDTYVSAVVVPATKTLPPYWFYIGKIKAKTDAIAVNIANSALRSLRGNPIPNYQDVPFFGSKKWVCNYQIDTYAAFATTD